MTAPVVTWMFVQRLAGHSAARITRALNDAGIPCPSAADPGRKPHRTGAGWTLRTVAAIMANPRYTGRQVWNRQRTDVVIDRLKIKRPLIGDVHGADAGGFWRYAGCMRYAQGGGLTAEGRRRREQVRLEAAEEIRAAGAVRGDRRGAAGQRAVGAAVAAGLAGGRRGRAGVPRAGGAVPAG